MISKKTKKIWGFAVVVALVVAYTIYDHQMEKASELQKEQQSLIVQLKPDQIQFVGIQNDSAGVTLALERQGDGWHLTQPLQELAKPAAIEEFLEGMVLEKQNGVAVEGDKIDLSLYGLDKPKATFTLKDNLGKSLSIAIGGTKNFQGDSFLRLDQEPRVLLASSTWLVKAEKKLDDFRDKRLLRTSAAKISKLQIQTETERFLLQQEKGAGESDAPQWVIAAHPEWRLDQNKVREFLRQLNLYEAIEVIAVQPPKTEEMKKWGLLKPRVVLSAELGENQVWTAYFAVGSDKVHRVHTSVPEMTMKLSPTESDRLAKLSADSFRDRAEPFAFDKSQIRAFQVNLGQKKMSFKLENEKWKATAGAADSGKIEKFLKEFSGSSLAQFAAQPQAAYNKEIILEGAKGETLMRFQWGTLKKVKISGQDFSVFEAKSSLYSADFTMMEADINSWKLDSLLQEEKK